MKIIKVTLCKTHYKLENGFAYPVGDISINADNIIWFKESDYNVSTNDNLMKSNNATQIYFTNGTSVFVKENIEKITHILLN